MDAVVDGVLMPRSTLLPLQLMLIREMPGSAEMSAAVHQLHPDLVAKVLLEPWQ